MQSEPDNLSSLEISTMKNKNVQIPKSVNEQPTRSAPCAMPSTNSHIPWRLFTQRTGPQISNFRARNILKHIVFFPKQPAICSMIRQIFLGLLNFIASDSFSSSCFIEILTTVTGKRKQSMVSTQADIMCFAKKQPSFHYAWHERCCLTCAARITKKNRSSPLHLGVF